MYDLEKSKRRIDVICEEITSLKKEAKTLGIEMQTNCIHKNAIESPEGFSDGKAALRQCIDCGLTEADFFGYNRLLNITVRRVTAEEFSASNDVWMKWYSECM